MSVRFSSLCSFGLLLFGCSPFDEDIARRDFQKDCLGCVIEDVAVGDGDSGHVWVTIRFRRQQTSSQHVEWLYMHDSTRTGWYRAPQAAAIPFGKLWHV